MMRGEGDETMPIPLAAAAAIGSLVGLAITVGKSGTDYASDEAGFERLRADMKRAAQTNDYVVSSHGTEEYYFLHREDWENPSIPVISATGYTNPQMQAMKIFVRPKGTNSQCRCVSFKPRDGYFSNDWVITVWGSRSNGMSKKVYTATTSECAALFKEKYINGDLAMQSGPRARLEQGAFA
jgi:hypothetical protein